MLCKFCSRIGISEKSTRQHERSCKLNPNSIPVKPSYGMKGKQGANQYTYGAVMSAGTRDKLKSINSRINEERWASKENRDQHSIVMQQTVAKYPDSYNPTDRGLTKQYIIDGIRCQGTWEVTFLMWCQTRNIKIERCSKYFSYDYMGVSRKYFPDFYLPETDTYIEVKGRETERDHAKWLHFPGKLAIIRLKEIREIKNGSFNGPEA